MFSKIMFAIFIISICVLHISGSDVPGVKYRVDHPDHPNKCWYKPDGKEFSEGEVFTANTCHRYTCHKDDEGFYLTERSCSYLGPQCRVSFEHYGVNGVRVEQDPDKQFPDCCSLYVEGDPLLCLEPKP